MYSHDGAATLHLRLARRRRNGVTWLLFFMGSLRTAVNTEHLYDVKMQGNTSTRGLDVPGKKDGRFAFVSARRPSILFRML